MMEMILFSRRHKEAIEEKKLSISLSKKIRQKIIFCMKNYSRQHEFHFRCSIFPGKLKQELMENYGETSLKAYVDDTYQEAYSIEQFILGAKPEYVLDTIEVYGTLIAPDQRANYYKDCNLIFKSEDSPFRILEGSVIKLDSDFLESEILNKAYELLRNNHFERACRYFLNARYNLTAGDYSGTISEANNAIESTLKSVLKKEKGEQGNLKKWLMKSGIIPDYFQGFCEHFEGLLQAAFTIANESSRHGKKGMPDKKNEVDYPVASFFLHLTGALIIFIMERYQESLQEDEVPF